VAAKFSDLVQFPFCPYQDHVGLHALAAERQASELGLHLRLV
jgi:hypothetical protein